MGFNVRIIETANGFIIMDEEDYISGGLRNFKRTWVDSSIEEVHEVLKKIYDGRKNPVGD